jgi:putative glutamine amidotransferase
MRHRPLKIGLSCSMMHPDPARPLFKGKRLLYCEESMFHWVQGRGAIAMLLPTPRADAAATGVTPADLAHELDALVMTGGVDVSPTNYGQQPLRPEWAGDPVRDAYDLALLRACIALDKPILGVCRGLQILNVALGGSLYQDIETQHPHALVHRNWELYDANTHRVRVEPGTGLARLFNSGEVATNSVHHQAIDRLADGLAVEARCADDGIIEAVRGKKGDAYLFAVQWHPEWHDPATYPQLLTSAPILDELLAEARRRKK